MPRKNSLYPFHMIADGDMSTASITSAVTDIHFLDDIAIQLIWTGTPTGTFEVQGSLTYQADKNGNVITTGTWTPLTLSSTPSASGSASNWLINLATVSFPYIRVVYTRASGSGTLQGWISGKEI